MLTSSSSGASPKSPVSTSSSEHLVTSIYGCPVTLADCRSWAGRPVRSGKLPRRQPARPNLTAFWCKSRYGEEELVYLVTDQPADQAQERYRLRMRIEEDSRDLKTTLGLKRLRACNDVKLRAGHLLLVAMVTVCIAA